MFKTLKLAEHAWTCSERFKTMLPGGDPTFWKVGSPLGSMFRHVQACSACSACSRHVYHVQERWTCFEQALNTPEHAKHAWTCLNTISYFGTRGSFFTCFFMFSVCSAFSGFVNKLWTSFVHAWTCWTCWTCLNMPKHDIIFLYMKNMEINMLYV